MKIFINPGHAPNGCPDPGAMNYHLKQRESDIAYDIGKLVEKYLKYVGFEVSVFQHDDLYKICWASNKFDADIFVSIHCNASNGEVRGTETFNYPGSILGSKLASCIQKQIIDSLYTIDRGTKEARYYVLKNTDAPAALVELEFIDNDEGCKFMLDNKDNFARAIARGITDFLQKR